MNRCLLRVQPVASRVLQLLCEEPLEMGRDCEGLLLADPKTSRRHVLFEPTANGSVLVVDLGSSNGTFLNGVRLLDRAVAVPGDVIMIGDTQITVGERPSAVGNGAGPLRTQISGNTGGVNAAEEYTSIERVADELSSELTPAIVGVEREAGTLTMVFSDIESSTELASRLGDVAWVRVLDHHQRLVHAHVNAHQGRIVKFQGDGYMMCFRSARQALLACIGLQRDLHRVDTPEPADAIRIRIGMHSGEVLLADDGDLIGLHVNVAARIAAIAQGGEILASSLVSAIASPRGDVIFGEPQLATLKGIDRPQEVVTVDWQHSLV